MPYKKTTMKKVTTMIALFFFLLSQSIAVAGNRSSRTALLDKLDQLDRMDFDRELSEFDQCFTKLDTGCARKHLQKAKLYAVGAEDTTTISKLTTMIDGVDYVIQSAKCIKSHSFTCAKNNMEKAEKIDGTETYRTLLKTNRQRYLAEKADYDREQQRLAETRKNSSRSTGRGSYQPSRGAATAGALLGAVVVVGGLAKLAQAVLGSGSSSSGSTHHSYTSSNKLSELEFSRKCQRALCFSGSSGRNCRDRCRTAAGDYTYGHDEDGLDGICAAVCNHSFSTQNYGCMEKCRSKYSYNFSNAISALGIVP